MDKVFDKEIKETRGNQQLDKVEFEGGREGFEVCKICHSIYHKKSWHHFLQTFKADGVTPSMKFVVCPACKMIQKGLYEGELVIKKVPEQFNIELVNLIKNFTHKSFLQDPMDRLIEIKKAKNGFTVKMTENQMTVRLAKKIKDAFNKVDLDIRYSKGPNDGDFITVTFN